MDHRLLVECFNDSVPNPREEYEMGGSIEEKPAGFFTLEVPVFRVDVFRVGVLGVLFSYPVSDSSFSLVALISSGVGDDIVE